jgi:hypothetical protein
MYSLKLCDNKYEVILDENPNNYKFEVLRCGEEWRSLIGDNVVLALVYKIQELQDRVNDLKDELEEQERFYKRELGND